ncbi:PTS system D-fructose-specific IIA component (F1P-forming) (Frc family) /PTS system D-fructose-specific IIB component (F1P-forming) (Frc family) /PTS system D-fructose-specific IIC component (F1P-forming) (Frc family) [Branchiibius hedensis]|uniref:PTS system D-fructose-specific IIA component (F1P-forming), Frc family /PTS system D-fructose-specific IIB component (F1P-forming), Frc family /PTS system D-fructose-specific IIC component (F1P-for... n=1 Tax=Branchiibius hedensis TaxID=672460 RepID=A0A2Y8ZQJ1_9MICO|nr:fructose-specific PTS transporter subunit EIIC [Branchiibius hedensis]PWJ25300.1 PTS system D-fructose-specific IIA component (F1P-forming) (Frc family) /PTS system D-fructose-specific IIB component (F1P-forming) (Frc family) /PTS system D-fructose-specific IIC component (F1P-forming) (Frc family) [Branchiibius hedensis]SSA34114.1 PTS system D-fructose-specific IIA component (F1P-forming), Frc family /PTS system D-fructose-specific IIB component (F1P-forming), Frc family /PTS system D-fructose
MSLITTDQVLLDLDSTSREDATTRLAQTLAASGRCTDVDGFLADVREREAKMATGLPGGIGIPHARSAAITEPSLAFARSRDGIDWGAKDGPAHLIFLIAAPVDGGEAHMQMLPKLAKALMNKDFRARLDAATSNQEVVDLVNEHVSLDETASATSAVAAAPAQATDAPASLTLVGVTSCPTGIAHTYMAAEALENAAREAGHTMTVETQGSAGLTKLTPEQIAAADAVIFAHDVEVRERDRFAGKPLIDVGVKKAISDGPALIDEAAALAAAWKADPSKAAAAAALTGGASMATKVDENAGWGTRIRQILMTGVSYMIPFVAAGGILIALGFMIAQFAGGKTGAIEVTKNFTLDPTSTAQGVTILQNSFNPTNGMHWAALFFLIGAAAFGFLVPILSGFIAFAIADRPGLVPGIVGGAVAVTMHAGFIGGIVTGFLGGFLAKWISSWAVPKGVRGVMPVVVIPLLSTLLTVGLFITVLGRPIKGISDGLTSWLNGMSGTSALVLGAILGAMMGFDLGGPVNKVAYTFATTGLAAAGTATNAPQLKIMAAVMAAGMVAPLGMALATTLRPGLFSEPERENGKAAWLLGLSFISEGAIPFAAADPWRVIVSSVAGSAVTGALAMQFGTTLRAPHGGIWVLPLIGNFLLFLVALVIGVLVTTALVVALKSGDRSRQQVDAAATV